MQNKSDAQLLGEYAAQRSEPAFAEIVTRHTDLVYSAALRKTGSPELAHEVAQMVFTDLARKACSLPRDVLLTGWLYQAARFAATKAIRGERRRQAREQESVTMQHLTSESTPGWEQLCPVLDDAMGELSAPDRDAILLRYFKNQDFHAVGLALGVSDAAAQKRVSRAVEHLREFLAKRGVTAGASGLVILISTNAVQAAPIGISAALATGALASAATVSSTLIQSILIAMKLKTILILTVVIAGVLFLGGGAGWYWLRHHERVPNHADSTLQVGLDRFMAAVRAGDTDRLMQCVSWRVSAEVPPTAAQLVRAPLLQNSIKLDADKMDLRVVSQTEEGEGVLLARVEWLDSSGRSKQAGLRFAREADGWKPAFNIYRSPSGGYGGTLFLEP